MILGSGMRMENEFMGGIAISQLDDMANSASSVTQFGNDAVSYNNKLYLKSNYMYGSTYKDFGFQSLNINTGSWCSLTSATLNSNTYGVENIGDKLYIITSDNTGSATVIGVTPYTPLTDTWGTTKAFYYTYGEDIRTASIGNLIYIAYEYANTSGSYTWHMKNYNTSTSAISSDLNFSVITTQAQSPTSFEICNISGSIICTAGSYIYKYKVASNTTTNVMNCALKRNMKRLCNINNFIYRGYEDGDDFVLEKIDIEKGIISSSYININRASNEYVVHLTAGTDEKLYTYGFYEYPGYASTGTTYRIVPKE